MVRFAPFELRQVAVDTPGVSLGDDIVKRRQLMQLTQQELADLLGVGESTISNWERGKHIPKNRLALLRAVLRMDDTPGATSTEPVGTADPLDVYPVRQLWDHLQRRIFGPEETGTPSADVDAPLHPMSGHHAPMPEHLLPPQSGERLNNDV